MAGTFATQFVSGRPEVDRRTQGREEDPVKRRIACKRGLQRKEKYIVDLLPLMLYILYIVR